MLTNQQIDSEEFILTNVKLETGFGFNQNDQVVSTQTSLFDIHISDGEIEEVAKAGSVNQNGLKIIDAQDLLMLPSLRDMHIHIDKTYYGGDWHAAPRRGRTVKDMIELEKEIIPDLLENSTQKAEACINLLQSRGTTFARCQANIDPTSGLKSLEKMNAALKAHKEDFEWETVAFPQHGILYSDSEDLLIEAAQMGVDYVGGLDPASIDGDMEKSLDIMFEIASKYEKGVDIHLHEGLPTGKATIDYMVNWVQENPDLQGRTFISHASVLAELDQKTLEKTADTLAEFGIGIITTIPIGTGVMPIPTLKKYGVKLMTGTDNLMDHWGPFGSGDMLQKAQLCARLYGWSDEYRLNRALQIVTNDLLPLDDEGNRQWPVRNSKADFILVDASCSAEAVARLPKREAVFYQGRQIKSTHNFN